MLSLSWYLATRSQLKEGERLYRTLTYRYFNYSSDALRERFDFYACSADLISHCTRVHIVYHLETVPCHDRCMGLCSHAHVDIEKALSP